MKIVIATVQVPFVRGGAEIHAESLLNADCGRAGHEAEIVAIPFKWYPAEHIMQHLLSCRLLDLTESDGVKIDCLIGLKFPAYLIPHPTKVLWVLHQYRSAYDLWDHPFGDLRSHPQGLEIRAVISRADRQAFQESKAVFANSKNVAHRMKTFCEHESTPLYHPPSHAELFYTAPAEDYLFFPSRFTPIKRQHLVLEALALTNNPVQVRFASSASSPSYTNQLFEQVKKYNLEKRALFVGDINEQEKRRSFAEAIAVVFPPVDEDYGYVTLEAMLSSKPVITCWDSGGPLEFVRDQETGLVAEPTAESLAFAMDTIWENRTQAVRMGSAGRDQYATLRIEWPHVVGRLLSCV